MYKSRVRHNRWCHQFQYLNGFGLNATLPSVSGSTGTTEFISYDGGPKTKSSKRCTHTRAIFAPLGMSFQVRDNASSKIRGAVSGTYGPTNLIYYPGGLSIAQSTVDAISNSLAGVVPQQMALYNFLLEIPQTLSLHKALVQPMREFAPYALSKLKRKRRASVAAANTVLAAEFGLMPLIDDLHTLLNLSQTLQKHCNKLAKVPKTGWQHMTYSLGGSATAGVFGSGSSDVSFTDYQTRASGMAWARVQAISGVPPTPPLSMYADALGLGNVAGAVWEATPFSFVVDWFYSVGDKLDSMSHQFSNAQLRVKEAGHWTKTETSASVRWNSYRMPDGVNYKPICGTALGQSFVRAPGIPTSTEAFKAAGLRQGILGGMLVLQRQKL